MAITVSGMGLRAPGSGVSLDSDRWSMRLWKAT
jgi:hypothetical protein